MGGEPERLGLAQGGDLEEAGDAQATGGVRLQHVCCSCRQHALEVERLASVARRATEYRTMDTAEGEQRRKPMDTAEVRRVGWKQKLGKLV
jgi:hypothetical protein